VGRARAQRENGMPALDTVGWTARRAGLCGATRKRPTGLATRWVQGERFAGLRYTLGCGSAGLGALGQDARKRGEGTWAGRKGEGR
jgi:hypothetical protein